jgi:hypothetical protein
VPGGWCILPDTLSISTSYVAVVSARHALPTVSCTAVSQQRLGRQSDGQSVRSSGPGAAQLTRHQPRVTRGRSKILPPQPSPRGDEPLYSVTYSPSGSVNPHKVSRARSHGTVARRQSARRCNLLKSARMARPPRARLRERHQRMRSRSHTGRYKLGLEVLVAVGSIDLVEFNAVGRICSSSGM